MEFQPFLLESYGTHRGFDESRKLDPSYYITDFWNDIADPDINGKPFMSGGPWGWIALVSFLTYWIKFQGPRSMKGKEAKDLRPLLLILNGFAFGALTTGVMTGLWHSNWGMTSFSCTALDPKNRSLDMWIKKTIGYLFIFGKTWEFIRPIIAVYRKRDSHITNMYLVNCCSSVLIVWLGLKLYPGGVLSLLPYLDGIYQIFAYGYLIKASASSVFKPSSSYRTLLYRIRSLANFLLLIHGLYFLMIPNCGPTLLKVLQVIYATVGLIVGPGEFERMEAFREIDLKTKIN